ncbi:SGNH/GDSL hydrolase family protein [Dermatophilaceae bacterium Soc4.6]
MSASPSRRGLTALAGGVTALAAGAAYGVPAQAAGLAYVALGDSYSSGVGTRAYLSDGTSCQRSVYAYPSLIAAARGYSLTFRACSGATSSDVSRTQLDALTTSTRVVTLTVGGNDAGFASVLTTCAAPSWLTNCTKAVDTAQAFIAGTLPARLSALYSSIRTKAPNAVVVVSGYPRVFNGQDCNALTFFSPAEETRLNQTADQLDGVIAAAAAATGVRYSSPTSAFVGHAVCGSPEWLNGLSNPVTDSYHPNRLGHASGYTPVVSTILGTPVAADTAVVRAAEAMAPELTAQSARYAARDATVTPQPFVLPDLTTPQAKAAARAAGVDLSDPRSIRAADLRFAEVR